MDGTNASPADVSASPGAGPLRDGSDMAADLFDAIPSDQWAVAAEIMRGIAPEAICEEFEKRKRKVPYQDFFKFVAQALTLVETYESVGRNRADLWSIELWHVLQQRGRQAAAAWVLSNHAYIDKTERYFSETIHLFIFVDRVDEATALVKEASQKFPKSDFRNFLPILEIAKGNFEIAQYMIESQIDKLSPRLLRSSAIFALVWGEWAMARELLEKVPAWATRESDRWIVDRIQTYEGIVAAPREFSAPPIFAVAAPQGSLRSKRLQRNLNKFGATHTLVPPIYGAELPAIAQHIFSNGFFVDRADITRVVSIFLGHARAWEAFLFSDAQSCIILEDDAMFMIDPAYLMTLADLPSYDVVFINERMENHDELPRDSLKIEALDTAMLKRTSGGPIGGDGYYLTRTGAKCLLEKARETKFYTYVDGFILNVGLGRHGPTDAKFGVVTPSLVREYADVLYIR